MALTGACLVLFVTFHALMNGVALFWPSAYNEVCLFLGANWYALIASAGLAALFILHIVYALWLTVQNRNARGSERYDVTSRPKQVEWASKNMLVLGIVVVAFLVLHLIQFWSKMQLAEICGFEVTDADGQVVPPAAGTWFLAIAFRNPVTLVVYLIGFVALWFHMTHGFWSMMQTVGWNNDTWMCRLKTIGNAWVSIVIALFIAQAIVFTVQAHRGVYNNCPALQEQYMEMAAHGHGASAVVPATNCASAKCASSECVQADCTPGNCVSENCSSDNCAAGNCASDNCASDNCAPAQCANRCTENVTVTVNE